MIEQPKRQTGPREAQWFYAICPACQKLLEVTAGKWPAHDRSAYTTMEWVQGDAFAMQEPVFKPAAACENSGKLHGT